MAKLRQPQVPQLEVKSLTRGDIEKGIAKLRRRIEELGALNPESVRFDDAQVENVERDVRDSISDIFGGNSREYRDNRHHKIWHGGLDSLDGDYVRQSKFAAGIPQTRTMLQGLIKRLEELREDSTSSEDDSQASGAARIASRKVFVVHGHDEGAKEAVARLITKLELDPIILHEQPNSGRTVIEKFEQYAAVDFAVVLLTPDDFAHAAKSPGTERPRARQNVVFELGYFIGKLGRERVCALHRGGVEILSDYSGVLYVAMDDANAWHFQLAREIKAAGIAVDLNSIG